MDNKLKAYLVSKQGEGKYLDKLVEQVGSGDFPAAQMTVAKIIALREVKQEMLKLDGKWNDNPSVH